MSEAAQWKPASVRLRLRSRLSRFRMDDMTRYEHYRTMTFSLKERILTATLNRPEKLNIFTEEMEREVTQFFVDGAFDKDFDIVILTGAGRAFSAGGDVEKPDWR